MKNKPPKYHSHIISDELFVRLIQNACRYGGKHAWVTWTVDEEKRTIERAVKNARTAERKDYLKGLRKQEIIF